LNEQLLFFREPGPSTGGHGTFAQDGIPYAFEAVLDSSAGGVIGILVVPLAIFQDLV
jgi:hypothetical protein